MSERKLATVRVVDDILVHENADSLEIAVIGGWKVVVKKGEYNSKKKFWMKSIKVIN